MFRKPKPIVTPDMDDLEATEAMLGAAVAKGAWDAAVWRAGMLRQIRTVWCLFCAVGIGSWALLPWRIGWQGVSTCLWLTFSIGYSGFFVWFSPKLAKIRSEQ